MKRVYVFTGQVIISGNIEAVDTACVRLKKAGTKGVLPLTVSSAFHSPSIKPAL